MKRKIFQKVKFNYSLPLMLIVTVFIFNACNEEQLSPVDPAVDTNGLNNAIVEDGRIVFDNPSSLESFMKDAQAKDFIDEYVPSIRKYENYGFNSLVPLFEEDDIVRIEEYKQAKIARLRKESAKNGRAFYEEDIDDEDELIADSYFASLLNEKRELQVGDMVYKYTEYGAFYTMKDNLNKLYQYLENVNSSKLASLPAGEDTEIVPGIYLFKQDYRASIQDSYQYENARGIDTVTTDLTPTFEPIDGPDGGGGGSAPKPKPIPSAPDPLTLGSCGAMNSNLITKIFGPAITCHDYFDSKKRIRVRAWNQNFAVYSSLGVKVKSQRKRVGIWWESDADELILGIDVASFKIPAMGSIPSSVTNYSYEYSYNGYLVDQYGNISSRNYFPTKPFKDFPVRDTDHEFITAYIFGGSAFGINTSYTLTGSDINKYAKDAFKSGVDALKSHFSKSTLASKPAVIVHTTDRDIYLTIANYKKKATNKSRIEEVFDWNVLVKLSFNPSTFSGFSSLNPQPVSYSYKEYIGSFYGMGRRGSTWKGRRVDYSEKR